MEKSNSIQQIKLSDIVVSKDNPRKSMDMEAVRELAESIRDQGLLQPVVLRPYQGKYELRAGHRRRLAVQMLGWERIPSIIREMDDRTAFMVSVVENIQRENLTFTEQGEAYNRMKNEMNMTIAEIAKHTGKRKETIKQHLRLLKLPDEFKSALDQRTLSIHVADILMRIPEREIMTEYLRQAVEGGCSRATAAIWLRDYERTKENTYNQLPAGSVPVQGNYESKPSYFTCDLCHAPEDIRNVCYMSLCKQCNKSLSGEVSSLTSDQGNQDISERDGVLAES